MVVLKCGRASAGSVVQVCPPGGTYCLSSSQIAHCAGGSALSGYCVPQAVQMNRAILTTLGYRAPRDFSARIGKTLVPQTVKHDRRLARTGQDGMDAI